MYPCINVSHLLSFKIWSYTLSSPSSSNTSHVPSDVPKNENKLTSVTSSSSLAEGDAVNIRGTKLIPNHVPQGLYMTCALLVSHGIPVLEHLLPRLQMDLSALQSAYDIKRNDDITRIRKIGVISLNSSVEASTIVEVSETITNEDPLKKVTVAMNNPCEEDNYSGISWAIRRNHQVLDILDACLQANLPWEDICSLLDSSINENNTPRKVVDDILEACCYIYNPIGTSLCYYIEGMLSDLYMERIRSKTEMVQVRRMLLNDSDDEKPSYLGNNNSTDVSSCLFKTNRLAIQSTLLDVARALHQPLRCVVNTGSIAHYPSLYSKLLRLVHSFLTQDVSSEAEFDQDTNYLFESFLVPSICLFPFNTALSAELWSVLSMIPYPIRYSLYGSIRSAGLEKESLTYKLGGGPRKPLPQIESEVESGREVRYRLRRVSMENVREMGRQLAKVANTNPLVVFTAILNQIESYDNLISLMVDTFDFLTSYSLDVLGYCLLNFLSGRDTKLRRTKIKDDGISTAQWLSSLATFIGSFYRKFPDVEVHGLLAHMLKKISEGSVVELCVLQSLLKTAGGYAFADCSSIASLSQMQLEGRCGSLELRRETSDFGVIEKYDPTSSSKLRSALHSKNFGTIFLILLCQIRYKLINVKMPRIKLIGNALDMCQRTIFLLLTFITESLEEEANYDDSLVAKYSMSLPSPRDLFLLYSLEPVEIWTLHRPIFRGSLSATSTTSFSSLINHEMIDNMVSECFKQAISPTLYSVFFVLSIYDISYPEERYMLEINRLNREIDRLTKLQKGGKEAKATISAMNQAAAAAGVTGRDLRDASLFTKTHEQDLTRLKRTVDKLSMDKIRQKAHNEKINSFLIQEKGHLFAESNQCENDCKVMRSYISECISPRCRLSPENAIFCSKFTSLLHKIETPNFYLLFFYDTIIESLERIIYGLTEDEASNFAIFFQDLWTLINMYRFDANLYESSLHGKIGSFWPTDTGLKQTTYDEFLEMHKRWHDSVALVLLGALEAVEYMFCRTSLILLSRLVHVFPTYAKIARKLIKALLRFQATDFPMQDIKAMAQGYKSQLLKALDEGLWKEEKTAILMDCEQNFEQKLPHTDLDTMEITTQSEGMNGHGQSSGNLQIAQEKNVSSIGSAPKPPDDVSVLYESRSSSSIKTENSVDSNERGKTHLNAMSTNDNDQRPDSRERYNNNVHNNGDSDVTSTDPVNNINKVDGSNLGTRWEKADESRDRKRKATYHTSSDIALRRSDDAQRRLDDSQRRSDGKSYGRQQFHRRSY